MSFLRLSTDFRCITCSPQACGQVETFVDEAFVPVYNFHESIPHAGHPFQRGFPQLCFPYFQTETQFHTYPQPLLHTDCGLPYKKYTQAPHTTSAERSIHTYENHLHQNGICLTWCQHRAESGTLQNDHARSWNASSSMRLFGKRYYIHRQ